MTKSRPTREEMCAALVKAGIYFPPQATLMQIRTLYDESFPDLPSMVPGSSATSSTNSVVVAATSASVSTSLANPAATFVTAASTSGTAATTFITAAPTSGTAATTFATGSTSATSDATSVAVATTSATDATTSVTAATTSATAAIIPKTSVMSTSNLVTSAPASVTTVLSSVTLGPSSVPAAMISPEAVASGPLDDYDYDAQLDAELSRLRKQKEIMDLQRALSGVDSQPKETPIQAPVRIDLSAVESMVSPFSGDDAYDVNKWFNDLEDAFAILQFDERAQFVGSRRLTTGTASAFLRTISVHGYNELKYAMLKEFGRSFTLQEVFTCLKSRKLKNGESLKRYVIEMQEIASRAAVPEGELIDLIIEGIGDNSSNIAMLYGATTMDELKFLLNRYERRRAIPTSATPNRSTTAYANARLQQASGIRKTPVPNTTATTVSNTIRCFNCSKYGHYQSECPLPKRPDGSCFRCGSTSHVYRNCPSRATAQAAAVEFNHEDAVVEEVNALQMS